jgi:hypothetical protein
MAEFGEIVTSKLKLPGAIGNYYRLDPLGSGLVLPATIADLRTDLGTGRREYSVFTTPGSFNLNIPTWMADNDLVTLEACGGGASGGSGGSIATTTIACTGGSGGTGGCFNRTTFTAGFLRSLGSSVLALVVGAGGAAVAGAAAGANGATGNNGNDSTITVNGTVVNRATGGKAGRAGQNSGSSAPAVSHTVPFSGLFGGASQASSATGGNGLSGGSSTAEAPGGGSTAGGLTSSNTASPGSTGGYGAMNVRNVVEAAPTGNATGLFVPGSTPQIPYPGNGGGSSGGSTGTSIPGGNGIFGGGGSGSGAGRTGSGISGKGGDGYIVITFQGSQAPIPTVFSVDYQDGSVKPTTRKLGGTLQQGDRWYSPTLRIEFFWDSPNLRWQQINVNLAAIAFGILAGTQFFQVPVPRPTASLSILIIGFTAGYSRSGTQDASNFWASQFFRTTNDDISTQMGVTLNFTVSGGAPAKVTTFDHVQLSASLNTLITTADNVSIFQIANVKTNAPSQIQSGSNVAQWSYVTV